MVKNDEIVDLETRPVLPGFRKGMTKKKIVQSLSEDDWEHLDALKAAEERKTNPESFRMFVLSDQAVRAKNNLIYNIKENCCSIRELEQAIYENEVLYERKESKKMGETLLSPEELLIMNDKMKVKQMRALDLVRNDLAKLFTHVGARGLDKQPYYSEDDWNELFKDCLEQLREIGIKL